MERLRLRGDSLSVLISALYFAAGDASLEIEIAEEDLSERRMALLGLSGVSSLMWRAIDPLVTREWPACCVASGGCTERLAGRVALIDSAQAIIQLEECPRVSRIDALAASSGPKVCLPALVDLRLDAKIVDAPRMQGLSEPVVVEIDAANPAGTYAQYVPLGGGQTLFTLYSSSQPEGDPLDLARAVLARLSGLEAFLLDAT